MPPVPFALCRLYSLPGEQIWLDAAKSAVDHCIEADDTQHKDHWVAYSMNEITRHITDNPDYYVFVLRNVQMNLEMFLKTIYTRADRMLNGYFYPEYAMHMANPQRVLNTFMVRHDGYRIRIDDVQHNIGGYYLYYKNYDMLVEYGMLEAIDD